MSERIAVLRIHINNLDLRIIQAYAPTEASKDEELDLFYSTADRAIRLAGNNIMVMDDFNAKIGRPKPNEIITGDYD